jgi:hypothetical protein
MLLRNISWFMDDHEFFRDAYNEIVSVGGLAALSEARRNHPHDSRIQEHAGRAIDNMLFLFEDDMEE